MSVVSINATGSLLAALEENPGAYSWGHIYKGTERELVAAGLIRPEWLPGRGDNAKWRQCVVISSDGVFRLVPRNRRQGDPGEGETVLRISPAGKTQFAVWKELSPSEQAARAEELQPKRELELARMFAKAAAEEEQKPRGHEPWNPSAFRSELLMLLGMGEAFALPTALGEKCFGSRNIPAHKLSEEDLQRLRQKLAEAKRIIEESKVEPINHAVAEFQAKRPTLTLIKG